MKKLIFISILVLIGLSPQAQITDLELANMLIDQDINSLDSLITSTGYDYTITSQKDNEQRTSKKLDVYIDNQYGGVKLWEIETQKFYGRNKYTPEGMISGEIDYISTIFIRYRHSNAGDLKDFKAYEIPQNGAIKYEKEMGERLSHLKIEYHKEDL